MSLWEGPPARPTLIKLSNETEQEYWYQLKKTFEEDQDKMFTDMYSIVQINRDSLELRVASALWTHL